MRARAWEGERGAPIVQVSLGEEKEAFIEGGGEKKLFFPPPSPSQNWSLGSTFPFCPDLQTFSSRKSHRSTFLPVFPAPPPPHQLWGIWGSLRHSFRLQQQPAREWSSVIWEGKLPDQKTGHCECNREAFLFVHLHFPWILLSPVQFNSHWCGHPSQLEIDLSWDYFFCGWILWRTDLFTVND